MRVRRREWYAPMLLPCSVISFSLHGGEGRTVPHISHVKILLEATQFECDMRSMRHKCNAILLFVLSPLFARWVQEETHECGQSIDVRERMNTLPFENGAKRKIISETFENQNVYVEHESVSCHSRYRHGSHVSLIFALTAHFDNSELFSRHKLAHQYIICCRQRPTSDGHRSSTEISMMHI